MDVVALNEETGDILFCEVKWRKNVNAETLLADLKRKATLVDWNRGKRNEWYAIVAKSFKRRSEDALCLDLNDIRLLLTR